MTRHIDRNELTTDHETLQNYRDDLEHRINDFFIWALGESAITEMTRPLETTTQIEWTLINFIGCSGYISYRNETNTTVEQTSLG